MAEFTETQEHRDRRNNEFRELCYQTGLAIVVWQDVEEAHFALFLKMLGAPRKEICSAVYFSIEGFDSRHKMVGRMINFFLEGDHYESHRAIWNGANGGLYKDIKDANENRNKLAHYGLDFDIESRVTKPDGSQDVVLGPPRLQPNRNNEVSRLLGRTPDKAEHNLDPTAIKKYSSQFAALGNRLKRFSESLTLPPPQQGIGLLDKLVRHLDEPNSTGQSEAK